MTATKMMGVGKVVRSLRGTAAGLGLMLVSAHALADNVLQDVRYTAAPGGKVDITLQFASPVGEVQAFTTDDPPKIAIDLPETTSTFAKKRMVIGSGATSAVSAVEAGGRTRVVVDLLRPAGYTTRASGNLLVVTVDAGSVQAAGASMAQAADPAKRSTASATVSNIDFRRGDNGAGRVILRFDSASVAPDMRNDGKQVVVDVANAAIPEALRRRLDVTDFATPVVSVEPRSNAGGTRLVINTNGAYDSMAYQTGNEYVVEIAPKREAVARSAPGVIRNAGQVAVGGQQGRYTGKPVTFNFQDVPVRTVLQLIAEESNLNIVVADTVSGSVTLRLINVPWDQALEILLRAKGLDQRRDGNVVWVAPQAELSAYELAQNNARINLENSGELVTEYIPINYGNAQDLITILTAQGGGGGGGAAGGGGAGGSRGFLSARGSMSADTRTNTLLVIDTRKKIEEIRRVLEVLDRPVDQVLIEARVVIADESFARDLGASLSFNDTDRPSPTSDSTTTSGFNIDLGVTGGGIFNFGILRPSSNLDLALSALQEEGRGEVVSNPRVITTNQREATITQGDEIGYATPSTGGAAGGGQALSVPAFKEALLEMKVTPTITTDGRVFMSINIKKDDIAGFTLGVPSLTRRAVTTGVMVDSGATVVIGGVYEFRNRQDVSKLPWLGDVPVLGNLFKKKGKSHSKAELLVFVTPRVLQVSKR
jgi:type IV pilus assembly protein PilQ